MICLDRIEILGFKSFCDKTVLKIPEGITGIVGPNGCGKSNVVDAMNWVLGEQSAKTIRMDKMEEVIFNGSKNRKPLNMSQVSLIWKTEKGNAASPEVTVTRRLFRSGESQYEMNGELCRLKDIHGFFISEGFDPLAYSIIEQGKIDFLFSAKPMERRALIEEVAGVAEFKHKKRSAQMKLAENQLQLERIQDILLEVEKQLSSLKRQAAKARRFQILKEERNTIQKISFHRKFTQIEAEHHHIMELLQTRLDEEQKTLQGLQQQELISSDMKLRFGELENQVYQERTALHQLEMQIQESQNSLQSKRQRIEELRRGIAEKTAENEKLTREETSVSENVRVKNEEEAQLKQQTEELTQQHTALFSDLEAKTAEVQSLEHQAEFVRKEILDLLSNASHLKTEQTRLHTQHEHLLEDIQRKETELKGATGQRDQFGESMQVKTAALAQIGEETGYLEQTRTGILQHCEQLKVEWDRLQQLVQSAFKRRSELEHQIHKLDAQQHSSKFYNESAKSLLNLPSRQAVGMMMDFIETEPQFETAVENYLADKLNYLIVNEADSALASIDYLKQQGLGYCGFVIKNGHDPNPPALPVELREEIGFIAGLREVVRIKDEALPAVAPFMDTAVLVEDLGCAQGLIKKYPDYQFVTVQGDVILSPVVYAGGVGRTEDMPGLIAIHRRQRELTTELEQAEASVQSLTDQVRQIQERLEISNRELDKINEVKESKNKDRMLVQMELDQFTRDFHREEKLMQILSQEMAQFLNEKEAVFARSEQFALQLQENSSRREQLEQQFKDLEQRIGAGKEQQVSLQQRVHESRVQIAELKERGRALAADIDRLNTHCRALRNSIESNETLILQRWNETESTAAACTQLEAQQVELLRSHDDRKVSIEEKERRKEALSLELTAQETVLAQCRSELDRVRLELSDTQVEKTRIVTQREDLLSRCLDEMGVELESLQLPENNELNNLNEEELRNRLAETQMKIDRLGSINELALDEYVQMEERHRFLKTQYEDLKVSIETLLETIQRIDVTSLQRFREAFVGVQTHFQNLFQRLFNGGKCEMVLLDPENPNDSGIDVHVQPPGKRIQNINSLSGGEKALTGIAFLIALFQYHPSPFCVMDEVDAPLDDSNILRFTSLIAEMKEKVQFLIVTHMKQTMASASQLYGITMGEPGVSSVLSAKFEEAEAFIQ